MCSPLAPCRCGRNTWAALHDLPPIHKDPFDRMLIAQAMAADLVLVTTDREIPKYASGRFRVLS